MHDWVPRFTKLRLAAVILSAIAAIVVGVARITIVKEVFPVRTKIVRVAVPRLRNLPGEMTDAQCLALRKGAEHRAILNQWGAPKGDTDTSGDLEYSIKGSDRTCFLFFDYDNKLEAVSYDLPLH